MNIDKLKVGDIIGTTSYNPLASIIKMKTWGFKYALAQNKCSHIGCIVDRGFGLLYIAEMLATGISLTPLNRYASKPPKEHIVFIGRHNSFSNDADKVKQFNNWILLQHSKGVKYGWDDFFRESSWLSKIFEDKKETMICNELPREAFKFCNISYPESWNQNNFSPKDWQCWEALEHIEKEILV